MPVRLLGGVPMGPVVAFVFLALVGCPDSGDPGDRADIMTLLDTGNGAGGDTPVNTPDDGPIPDLPLPQDGTVDDTPDVAEVPECPGGFSCACEEPDDCDSGYCVPASTGESICTDTCIDECPEGFLCKPVPGPDVINVCVPKFDPLCAPCTADEECGDLCAEIWEGCAETCGPDSDDCEQNCVEWESEECLYHQP